MDISKLNKFNAFIAINLAVMNNEPEQLAAKTPVSEATLPAGTTFALADNISTSALKTTCASYLLEDYQPPFDSTAAQKMEAKGAMLVGKTNLDEFGVGAWGKSSYFGAVKNPLNVKHTAGSGAAAAVASGAVSLALGADRWGELRQSAAYCGVIGFKPTYGRISRSGLIDCAPSLEQLGIIARDTAGLAAALETISGGDLKDPTSYAGAVPPYAKLLQEKAGNVKAALPTGWTDAPHLTAEIKEAFNERINGISKNAFPVETVSLPHLDQSLITALIIGAVEAYSNMSNYDGIRFGLRTKGKHLQEMYRLTRTEGFSRAIKQFLTFGALISSGKYYNDYFLNAQKMRTIIKKELEQCLEQYDLIIIPTTPFKAPALEEEDDNNGYLLPDAAAYYTAAANLAGMPAITVPLPAQNKGDLPVAALQIIAKAWDEPLLLQTTRLLENSNL